MINEPTGAAEALAAFQRAASDPDPLFAMSTGFAILYRHHGRGVLSFGGCSSIANALAAAQAVLLPVLPQPYPSERLQLGVEALAALLIAWTFPEDAPERKDAAAEANHLCVRIIANDLDSACASLEIRRGSTVRPPIVPETLWPTSTAKH